MGDRVVVMRDGRVQQVGDPMELYNEPANRFVAGFHRLAGDEFRRRPDRGREWRALWAESDGIRIKVPADVATAARRPMPGKEVTFGVRPEDLRIAGDGDPRDLSFDAAVEVVERLGSEILLDVAVGSGMMVASVEPTVRAKVHEKLRLAINPARLHFFDPQSEAAI